MGSGFFWNWIPSMIYLIALDINEFMFHAVAQRYAEHAKKNGKKLAGCKKYFCEWKSYGPKTFVFLWPKDYTVTFRLRYFFLYYWDCKEMIEKAFVKCQLGKNLFWYSTNSFLTLTGNHKQTIKTKSIITVVIVMQQIIFGPKVKSIGLLTLQKSKTFLYM